MALGVTITTRTTPPTRGLPTATDGWFVAAFTDVGTAGTAVEVKDLAAFEAAFGTRTAGNILLWDWMDVFFREGGKRAIISRMTAATPAALTTALDVFKDTMGPGQVSVCNLPLTTADGVPQILFAHAKANNRIVLAAVPNTISAVGTVDTYIKQSGDTVEGYGGFFGYDINVPGQAGVAGAPIRSFAPLPAIAALCARVDETGNPNQAAAGRWLPYHFVQSYVTDPTMAVRATYLDVGFNTGGNIYGVLENYGFQTTVRQAVDQPFWQLNCSRLRMAIVARAKEIGENYMFKTIDGQGKLTGQLKGNLDSMLMDFFSAGALYGQEAEDAFFVDTGPNVNTTATISQGLLKASATVVMSLHAKAVQIELVSVPVGGSVL